MRSIKSASYWKDIIIRDLNYTNKRVMTLSVSFDGQLLLAAMNNDKQFYVYNTTNSSYATTLHLPRGSVLDLAWTLRDNIVYIATVFEDLMSVEVVTMSLNGSVIARTVRESIFVMYQSLSVSRDGAIYMTVSNQSQKSEIATQLYVYESINEGVTWTVVFKLPEDKHYWMVATEVPTDPQHIAFLTRAADYNNLRQKLENYSFRVYYKRRDAGINDTNVTWSEKKSIIQDENNVPKLIYDGQSTVFTTNFKDVYAWSVGGESEILLIDSSVGSTLSNPFISVSVDRQRNVLYAGRYDGCVVSVFNLTYT